MVILVFKGDSKGYYRNGIKYKLLINYIREKQSDCFP